MPDILFETFIISVVGEFYNIIKAFITGLDNAHEDWIMHTKILNQCIFLCPTTRTWNIDIIRDPTVT